MYNKSCPKVKLSHASLVLQTEVLSYLIKIQLKNETVLTYYAGIKGEATTFVSQVPESQSQNLRVQNQILKWPEILP